MTDFHDWKYDDVLFRLLEAEKVVMQAVKSDGPAGTRSAFPGQSVSISRCEPASPRAIVRMEQVLLNWPKHPKFHSAASLWCFSRIAQKWPPLQESMQQKCGGKITFAGLCRAKGKNYRTALRHMQQSVQYIVDWNNKNQTMKVLAGEDIYEMFGEDDKVANYYEQQEYLENNYVYR